MSGTLSDLWIFLHLTLSSISSPDMDVRKKATSLALDMVNSRNVEDVVLFLKKELVKTLSETFEKVRYLLLVICFSLVTETHSMNLFGLSWDPLSEC